MTNGPEIAIDGRKIGAHHPPYIVCELSGNHNGSLQRAKELIKAGVQAGAHAIKLQTYTADTMTLKSNAPEFQISQGLWAGKTLHDLYDWAHTPWEWHKPLFDYARSLGVSIFSSPFDKTAVDFLEDLNAPAYKIASFEAVDVPLIAYAASTGKPMIISTGMANQDEIAQAIAAATDAGCKQLAILHCVSGYPAPAADYNLRTIQDMQTRFGLPTGLSDHTLGNQVAMLSVAMGACIIEKHFTLDRNAGGPDDAFSLQPDEFAALCEDAKTAWQAIGAVDYSRKASEVANAQYRRSLYFVKTLKAGEIITADAVRSVRPGHGLAPKFLHEIIGKKTARDIAVNTPVTQSDIVA